MTINTCVMTMTQSGQSQTLECTGSARRDGSAVVNNLTMGALNAKMLEIRKDIMVHPSVKYNLITHKDFVEVHKYCAPEEIFHGEVGELHGFIIMENADAPVLGDTYKNKAGSNTYASYAFGQDAYCIIDPGNGNLEMIIKPKEQAGGPLNQFGTVGYKLETGSAVLYPERLLRIMSCTEFSGEDEAN